jgi:hypothetical protein
MTNKPRIFASFQDADPQGRLRLTSQGTLDDLASQGVELHGLPSLTGPESIAAEWIVTKAAFMGCSGWDSRICEV